MKPTNQRQAHGRKNNTNNVPLGSKPKKRKGSYCARKSEIANMNKTPYTRFGVIGKGRNGYIPTNPNPVPMPQENKIVSAYNSPWKTEKKPVVLFEELRVGQARAELAQEKKTVKKGPCLSVKRHRVNIGHITKGR